MRQKIILLTLFVFLASASSIIRAQEALKPSLVPGEVSSVSASEIVLKTKDGTMSIVLSDKTEYKRVPPENLSFKNAVAAAFADIGVGDKVVVSVIMAADKKPNPARTVYLMTKADLAGSQAKNQEQWRTNGVSGRVAAVNAQTKEITVTASRGLMGETKTLLTLKDNAVLRRYAPDSIKYEESQVASFDEIKVGDTIHARGEKSADGATVKAEEIVSGSFVTIIGTITAIDAAKNEITISNVQTKKPVTVVAGQNSILRKFPPEIAQRLAAAQTGGGGMQPPSGMRPPQGNQPGGQTPPNGMRPAGGGMRGGGIDDIVERLPTFTIADLKVGEMVGLNFSAKGATADRVTAIKLLSGVEPFLKAPQAAGNNSGRRRGADSGFSIPGLEGGGGF